MTAVPGTDSKEPDPAQVELLPRVLAVGGSDPSGAAGIQADLKTLSGLRVFGCSALTAVTVQNQYGVTEILNLPASVVLAQVDAVLADGPCEVVKTGMLGTADIVHGLADRAKTWGSTVRLVVDPVLRSSSGRSLLDEEGRRALVERLLPLAALLTPNLPEAEELTGHRAHGPDEMSLLADLLLARGASAVLIKGGHLLERDPELSHVTDLLRTADGEELRFERPRIPGPSRRGTGCTLASAIAAGIAEGLTLGGAVERAGDFVESAMRLSGVARQVRSLDHAGAGDVLRERQQRILGGPQ